jgi:hypothetical protein
VLNKGGGLEGLKKLSKMDRYVRTPMLLGLVAVEKTVRWMLVGKQHATPDREAETIVLYPEQANSFRGNEKRNPGRRRQYDIWARSFQLNPDAVYESARFKRDVERTIVQQPIELSSSKNV